MEEQTRMSKRRERGRKKVKLSGGKMVGRNRRVKLVNERWIKMCLLKDIKITN